MQIKIPSERTLVSGLLLFLGLLLWQSPIRTYLYGDSMGSLLTSQQLLKNGSPVLEQSEEEIRELGYTWQIRESKGKLLYAYPQGTSYLSVPAVLIANLMGYDMGNIHHQASVQKVLAITSLLVAVILLHLIARSFIPPAASIGLILVFTLGSTLASSVSIAFWNYNLELTFLLLSILLLTKIENWKSPITAGTLGLLLFLAFFCRPTAAPFIATTLLLLAIYHRRHFYPAAAVSGTLFAIHTLFSLHYYGSLTPGQHHFSALNFGASLLEGIAGTTISPSKGLFTNSPILVFSILTPFILWKRNELKSLDTFIAIGLLLHILAISSWGMWWGGGSFASRLCTDALPGYFYLLVRFLQTTNLAHTFTSRPALASLAIIASTFSIFVHTVQGTFNPWTERFNNDPLIGPMETKHFFDWRYPQFLASKKLLKDRNDTLFAQKSDELLKHLENAIGQHIALGQETNSSIIFIRNGFYPPEETGRWLSDTHSTFFLNLSKQGITNTLILKVEASYFGESEDVTLLVDGNEIGKFDLSKNKGIEIDYNRLDDSKEIHRFEILTQPGESPLELGISEDSRQLKLWLSSLQLTYKEP